MHGPITLLSYLLAGLGGGLLAMRTGSPPPPWRVPCLGRGW